MTNDRLNSLTVLEIGKNVALKTGLNVMLTFFRLKRKGRKKNSENSDFYKSF